MAMEDATQEHLENAEHAEHAAHEGNPFLTTVSVTIAVLAVMAATVGSFESLETADTINDKSEAAYLQNKASDQWSFFQAKSLKKNLYTLAADSAGPKADGYLAKAKHEGADQDKAQDEAKKLEAESRRDQALSQLHENRHHRLTVGATLLEIGIAISTIAIITRKRWPWVISAILGMAGAVVAASAYADLIGM